LLRGIADISVVEDPLKHLDTSELHLIGRVLFERLVSNGDKFLALLLRDANQITALYQELHTNISMLDLFQLRVEYRVQALGVESVQAEPVFFCDYFIRQVCNDAEELGELFGRFRDHD
jgi:hypothetical protein